MNTTTPSTTGTKVPSLAQSSTTQTPITTSAAPFASDDNQPLITAVTAQDSPSTGVAEASGVSTPPLRPIPGGSGDSNETTPSISLPTGPTSSTTGQNGTTQAAESTTAGTTTSPKCSDIKVVSGDYTYIDNMATRTLELSGLNNGLDNIKITGTPELNVTKSSMSNTSYIFENLRICEIYNISLTDFQCSPQHYIIPQIWNVPPDPNIFTLNKTENSTFVTFMWDIGNDDENCNLSYKYMCRNEGHSFNWDTPLSQDEVKGFNPNSTYSCDATVLHANEIIKTMKENVLTDFGMPDDVMGLRCIPRASDDQMIAFEWSYPKNSSRGIDGYIVECRDKKGGASRNIPGEVVPLLEERNTANFSCYIGEAYTEDTVSVQAFKMSRYKNDSRIGGSPVLLKCRTNSSRPDLVRNVKPFLETSNKVKITCNQPNKIKGPKTEYILHFDGKSYNKGKCDFHIKDLSYLREYSYELIFSNGDFRSNPYRGSITTKYNEKALIGFLAFLIIVTSIALIIVLFKIYKLQKRSSSDSDELCELVPRDDEKQLLSVEPISGDHLLETHRRKMADEARLFLAEFQSIPRVFSKLPIKDARESYNQSKNRYVDILPYDENRVELSLISGEQGSDYINASFINGFKEHQKYIAAQGPKDETTNDFWRMIWEQKSTIIVMVTRCEEGNRVKCAQYWPTLETGTLTFGNITVVIKEEKKCPDYIIRKLQISNKNEKTPERDITHIQFISWPDHGVPDDPYLLLKLRRRVTAFSNFFSGPIVVHCSAGVGRTGTYISIDAMMEGLDSENRVDVYGFVVSLRRQRCLMVQVEAQYILIHHALVEYCLFGDTEISVPELAISLTNLKKKDPSSDPSTLEAEFQRLPTYKNWRPQNVGNKSENKDKNWSPHVVPYEFNRVGIRQDDDYSTENAEDSDDSTDDEHDYEDSTKYINASFINGYWSPKAIIAAQGPLKNTLSDFWLMIFQRKVKCIVMLTSCTEENQGSCTKYWGDEKQTYDDIEVAVKDVSKSQSYTVRLFEVRHAKRKECRKIHHYQYENWNPQELPKDPDGLLTMIQNIKQKFPHNTTQEEGKLDKHSPILIHCRDGAQQTGTVCALVNLLQCAEAEGAVDVFHTVKSLRKERPGFVTTFEDYQFIYDTLAMVYPAQNGQLKKNSTQADHVEVVSETGMEQQKRASLNLEPTQDNGHPEDKESATSANGPVDTGPKEIELKIE
ncbi:receptor-type tyrosine-protein phosphatase C isoform X2 [Pleurodeles waltl]